MPSVKNNMISVINNSFLSLKKKIIIKNRYRIKEKRINYLCNISIKHKYLYMETPKVGCSSVKKNLQILENSGVDNQFPNVHDKSKSPLFSPLDDGVDFRYVLGNYYKFSFVRNPYVRALSCYLDKFREGKPKFREQLGFGPEAAVSFEEFLERVSGQDSKEMNIHWMPVSLILSSDQIGYDFIGRFERFENDLKLVMQHIAQENGLSLPESILYKSRHSKFQSNAGNKLGSYMTKRAQQLVQKIYAEDFEQFGYDLDLSNAYAAPVG
jgi:sulfotransferase famil protein